MTDQLLSRKQFEAAVIARLGTMFPAGTTHEQLRSALLKREPDGNYAESQRASEWWAWQASRLAMPDYTFQNKRATVNACAEVLATQYCRANGCSPEEAWSLNAKAFVAQSKAIVRKVRNAQKPSQVA